MNELKPWPPSARHHHGFLRYGIMWVGDDNHFPVAYVDDQVGDRGNNVRALHDQRRDEWMEWFTPEHARLKGHPCLPPFRCIFTFMGEVLALAVEEGVDTSIVTGETL